MTDTIEHYGWPVSPYTAKTRSYLQFKQIPFQEKAPTILGLRFRIQKNVGAAMMPTIQFPDGRWVQDSSDIIDTLEAMHPTPSIHPTGPTQRLISYLFELHGDEWLPMAALHYRWHVPTNKEFALREFGKYGFPGLPHFITKKLVQPAASKMEGYLSVLGITENTIPALEQFTEEFIANLNIHFTAHRFLLGDRPCLGDFALFGPLWAHLYRDPGTTYLFDDAPALRGWMEQLLEPSPFEGDFLPNDEVPPTLLPILRRVFQDQIPWVQTLQHAINRWCERNPEATRVPRALGFSEFKLGDATEKRKLATFVQWKAQRPWDAYQKASAEDKETISKWIESLGFPNPFENPIKNPFVRENFKAVLARSKE